MDTTRSQPEEFEKLILPYEKKIYFTCLHMMGNVSDAQDCAQEAILRAFRAYGRFRNSAKFSTWIFRITNNVCVDALRKRHLDVSFDEIRQNGYDPPSDAPSAFDRMEESTRKEKIRQAMMKVPKALRIVLILRDLHGLSYDEIASSLKIPSGTVKSRINRAREKLLSILASDTELL